MMREIFQLRKLFYFAPAIILVIAVAGCGGGGGGSVAPSGGTTTTPTGTTHRVTVSFNNAAGASRTVSAGAEADREARLAVAGVPVIAYLAGDSSKTVLNSQSDRTDAAGSATIDINIGSNTTADVIIEALADPTNSNNNVLYAIDDLSADKVVSATPDTARKALLFHYNAGQDMTNINLIDNLFDGKGVDLRNYISGQYSTAAGLGQALITQMKIAIEACSVTSSVLTSTQKSCLATEIARRVAVYADSQNVDNLMSALESSYRTELGLSDETFIVLSGRMYVDTARRLDRSAAAGTISAPVKVYQAGDSTKTLLNSSADKTDANGYFEVTASMGSNTSMNMIVEGVLDPTGANNVYIPLANVSSAQTGLVANGASTRKGYLYHLAPTEDPASTLNTIVGLFDDKALDVRNYITGDYSTAASLAASMLTDMKTALNNCSVTSSTVDSAAKTCLASQLESSISAAVAPEDVLDLFRALKTAYKVELGTASINDTLYALDSDSSIGGATIDKLIAIFNDADSTFLSSISTEAELEELVAKLADAFTAWDSTSYSTTLAKRVAIKDVGMSAYFGETFTTETAKTAINNLSRVNGYYYLVRSAAADLSSSIAASEMGSMITAYDNVRGMFVDVFTTYVSTSRATGYSATEAMLDVLAALGGASENTSSMAAILDNWVVEWAKTEVATDLMTGLGPMEMADRAKTDQLMQLAHDLADLGSSATDAQIRTVMLANGLSAATADVALALYNKAKTQTCTADSYYSFSYSSGIVLNLSSSELNSSCVCKEDIVQLMETHYAKSLPKFEAFIDGLETWLEDGNNLIYLLGVANTSETVQTVYSRMKASAADKSSISTALDAAGIKSKLFWLAMNLEPYINL